MSKTVETTPLYSEEVERAVLGGILHDPQYYVDVKALVGPDDYFLLRHTYIFEAFIRLAERGDDINLTSAADELRAQGRFDDIGGTLYLAQLLGSTPNVQATESFARKIADYAYRRRLTSVAMQIRSRAEDLKVDVPTLRADAERLVLDADANAQDNGVVSLGEEFGLYMDEMEATQYLPDGVSGLSVGFGDFDDVVDGLQPESLNILAGRPGMGKSAFMMAAALNVARNGGKVYVWSGEMPKKQLRQRLMSMQSGIPGRALQRGLRPGGMSASMWSAFVKESGVMAKLPIYLDDIEDMTPALLKARCQRLARRIGGLDLIVVDYVQIMDSGLKTRNRVEEISHITRHLKKLAKIAPVLAGAQLSRAVEQRQDKRPLLSDLRESGTLEQDGDTVTFLYRDSVYNDQSLTPNRADVIVAKNRHGATGTVYMHFDASVTRFADMANRMKVGGMR